MHYVIVGEERVPVYDVSSAKIEATSVPNFHEDVDGVSVPGYNLKIRGIADPIPVHLIKVGGVSIPTYCVDIGKRTMAPVYWVTLGHRRRIPVYDVKINGRKVPVFTIKRTLHREDKEKIQTAVLKFNNIEPLRHKKRGASPASQPQTPALLLDALLVESDFEVLYQKLQADISRCSGSHKLWIHSSTTASVDYMREKGFNLKQGRGSRDLSHGNGVYFSDNPFFARSYAQARHVKPTSALLVKFREKDGKFPDLKGEKEEKGKGLDLRFPFKDGNPIDLEDPKYLEWKKIINLYRRVVTRVQTREERKFQEECDDYTHIAAPLSDFSSGCVFWPPPCEGNQLCVKCRAPELGATLATTLLESVAAIVHFTCEANCTACGRAVSRRNQEPFLPDSDSSSSSSGIEMQADIYERMYLAQKRRK